MPGGPASVIFPALVWQPTVKFVEPQIWSLVINWVSVGGARETGHITQAKDKRDLGGKPARARTVVLSFSYAATLSFPHVVAPKHKIIFIGTS